MKKINKFNINIENKAKFWQQYLIKNYIYLPKE